MSGSGDQKTKHKKVRLRYRYQPGTREAEMITKEEQRLIVRRGGSVRAWTQVLGVVLTCASLSWIDRFSLGPNEEGSKRGCDGSRGGRGSS